MSTRILAGMAVELEGDGAPVIMIHGLGGTSNSFTPQLAVYAGRHRIIRPDLVGSGRSPLEGALSIERFVSDVMRMADGLGAREAHLVGHSLGTIVCQHIAVRHPARVRSLALLGALTEPPDAARAALRQRAAKARAEGMAEVADAIVQAATAKATKADAPVAVAMVRESVMRQCPQGYAATCEALAQASAAEAGRIDCPTMLITGAEDAVAPPAMARGLADRIAGARLVLLPRCGHWPSVERAADVNRELRHFMMGLRG